jgi:O-antigen/teichoic acid export membrane protein
LTNSGQENHAKTVRDSLSRNLMADMAARIGYLLSRFFIPPFILAHIGMEAYGLWATAFILVSYVGVSTMGISNVYIKYVAEYSARRDYKRVNELLSTGLLITVPVSCLIFAMLWLFWPLVVNYLHVAPALREDARVVVLSVVAIFLASISLSAFRDVMTGVQKSALMQLVWVTGYLTETALIFWLVGAGKGVRGLAEAFLIRTAIEIGLAVILAFRMLPWLRVSPGRFSREAVRTLFSFGGVVQIQSFLAIALNSVERAMAAPLIGLAATGLLDIANKLPSMAASMPSAFAGSFVPAASYLQGGPDGPDGQREAIRKLYLKGARYMNLTCAYICGFIAAMPLTLLDVWMGKRYPGVAFLMVVFTIQTQVHLMTGPGTSILKGLGRPKEEFYYALPNVAALLLAVPLFRIAMGQWTAVGIGMAVTVSTIAAALFFLRHANRILNVNAWQYIRTVVWPGVVPYLVGLIFTYPVLSLSSHLNRVEAAGVVLAAGLAYTVLLAFITIRFVLETGERLWFMALIASKLRPIFNRRAVAVEAAS